MGLPQPQSYQFQKTFFFLSIFHKVPGLSLTDLSRITSRPVTADWKMSYLTNQDGSHVHPGTSLKGITGRCFPKRKPRRCLQPKGQEMWGATWQAFTPHTPAPGDAGLQEDAEHLLQHSHLFFGVSLVCPSLCELLHGGPGSFVQEHLDPPGHQGHEEHTKGASSLCVYSVRRGEMSFLVMRPLP